MLGSANYLTGFQTSVPTKELIFKFEMLIRSDGKYNELEMGFILSLGECRMLEVALLPKYAASKKTGQVYKRFRSPLFLEPVSI